MFDKIIQAIKSFLKTNGNENIGRNNDVQRTDCTGMADDTARIMERYRNRSDLRVFEEGLDTSYGTYSHYSERTRCTAESERLVKIAKKHGLFIPIENFNDTSYKIAKRTGESVVYVDTKANKVIKVKDPYAKFSMKGNFQPEDAVFEHLVHNQLFPETAYTFKGISEELGEVRIILTQDYIPSIKQPTKQQITEDLAKRGLFPEDRYTFGNEMFSVTDVMGDNTLLGEDDTLYFIDPIIHFKKAFPYVQYS